MEEYGNPDEAVLRAYYCCSPSAKRHPRPMQIPKQAGRPVLAASPAFLPAYLPFNKSEAGWQAPPADFG